jgi:hypothetical protein
MCLLQNAGPRPADAPEDQHVEAIAACARPDRRPGRLQYPGRKRRGHAVRHGSREPSRIDGGVGGAVGLLTLDPERSKQDPGPTPGVFHAPLRLRARADTADAAPGGLSGPRRTPHPQSATRLPSSARPFPPRSPPPRDPQIPGSGAVGSVESPAPRRQCKVGRNRYTGITRRPPRGWQPLAAGVSACEPTGSHDRAEEHQVFDLAGTPSARESGARRAERSD